MTREEIEKQLKHKRSQADLYASYAADHQQKADEWKRSVRQVVAEMAMLESRLKELKDELV